MIKIEKDLLKILKEKSSAKYNDLFRKDLSVEYSLAIQILVVSLGDNIVDILNSLFPEAIQRKVHLKENYRILESDGCTNISHTYNTEAAPCIARIIYLAHCVLDLEQSNVRNFARIKEFCSKKGVKARPFERTYYEIIIAARMAHRNIVIEFLEEQKTKNKSGQVVRTPDLLLKDKNRDLLIETKCNVFRNLDNTHDYILRTKRIFDRFEDGCNQIQQFGDLINKQGLVYVQYFSNAYLEYDKDPIRLKLDSIAQKYSRVIGGGFTYELYNSKKIETSLKFHGFLKAGEQRNLNVELFNAIMFQDAHRLPKLEERLLAMNILA